MLCVLQAIDVIFTYDIRVIQKRIIWRINRSVGFLAAQNFLITFRASDVLAIVLADETLNIVNI